MSRLLILSAFVAWPGAGSEAATITWTGESGSEVWSDPGNWMGGVPADGADLLFGANAYQFSYDDIASLQIGTLTFGVGAPIFEVTIFGGGGGKTLSLTGDGFVNLSGVAQRVIVAAGSPDATGVNSDGGVLQLRNSASAGNIVLVNQGAFPQAFGGRTQFFDNATAGQAIIENRGARFEQSTPGQTIFSGNSSAGQATIRNFGGSPASLGGTTIFEDNSTAGGSVITSDALTGSEPQYGGRIEFRDNSTAGASAITTNGARAGTSSSEQTSITRFTQSSTGGSALLTVNGGSAAGAPGGLQVFEDLATAGAATLVTNGGTNGGEGGRTWFIGQASGGTARAITNAGGLFDISGRTAAGMQIGSIEGAGTYSLGAWELTTGSNNSSTEVSGVIQDGGVFAPGATGGGLTKIGTGTLTLTGANTYTGPTVISSGALLVNGSLQSAVNVMANAKLGGAGAIMAPVAVGDFGVIAPGGLTGPGTLTMGDLILNNSSHLDFDLDQPGVVGGGSNDLLQVNGNLVLDGLLNVTDAGRFDSGTYRLINYVGAFSDNGLDLGALPPGIDPNTLTIQTSVMGQVNLIVDPGSLLFWDGTQTAANGAVDGGSGAWNNTATNWTNSAGALQSAWGGKRAVFTGAAGTVTLGENVTTTGMQFVTDGYAIRAAAAETITLDGAAAMRVDAGVIAMIDAPLTGASGSLFKTSAGTLILNAINTYGSTTNISAGTLLLNGSTAASSLLTAASGATLGGTGAAHGAVTITNGGRLAPGVNGPGTLTLGALTMNPTSNLLFDLGAPGTVGGVSSDLLQITSHLTLDGVLSIADAGNFGQGTYRLFNYAGALTDNGLIFGGLPAGFTDELTVDTSVPGQVNLVVTDGTAILYWDGSHITANGFVNGGAGSWDNGTSNWTNATGTVNRAWAGKNAVFSGVAGAVTLAENVATRGLHFVTNGYTINAGAGQTITLDGTAALRVESGASVTINAALAGGALEKLGDGALVITASNSYSGGTSISRGRITNTSASGYGLGTGPVYVAAGGALDFTASSSAGPVLLENSGGSVGSSTGEVRFFGGSTAGTAVITNHGNAGAMGYGAYLVFLETANGGSGTINNLGGSFAGPADPFNPQAEAGQLFFLGSSRAGAAQITNFAGTGAGLHGGQLYLGDFAAAGTASITNHGGAVAEALGGATLFSGNSHAGIATLIAEGGANGGFGGTVVFTQNASGGAARMIFVAGGTADASLAVSNINGAAITIGSIEGNGLVKLGGKRLEVGGNGLSTTYSGEISGVGGVIAKVGAATLTLLGDSTYTGGTNISGGALHVGNPEGLGLGAGPVLVQKSLVGSALWFIDSANAGAISITNQGQDVGTFAARTIFKNASTAGFARITNEAAPVGNGSGSWTSFLDSASAGSATISNEGSRVQLLSFLDRGYTEFRDGSTAAAAVIFNHGSKGGGDGNRGGRTVFSQSASAGAATVENKAGTVSEARGGETHFFSTSQAGTAHITNAGATVNKAFGGAVTFQIGASSAEGATIVNQGASVTNAPTGQPRQFTAGHAQFFAGASASTATIINEGALAITASGGFTEFFADSSAGQATVFNKRTAENAWGGQTMIRGSAGSATFINEGGQIGAVSHGTTYFADSGNAQFATLFNEASTTSQGSGGLTVFDNVSLAGNAVLDNEGAKVANGFGGEVWFVDRSSGGFATITNRANTIASTPDFGGTTLFWWSSTAGAATVINEGGLTQNTLGGRTHLSYSANAGTATFTNEGGASASAGGGVLDFDAQSTASQSTIHNQAGTVALAFAGRTRFIGVSQAGQSVIHSAGATIPGAESGRVFFFDSSSAGGATLYADPGIGIAAGGAIVFQGTSDGGTARAILGSDGAGGGLGGLDISLLSDAGMSIGSIEGSGIVSLGSKKLEVGSNHLSTEFSGRIREGGPGNATGGSLTKVGSGTLTLSGVNTFTGSLSATAGVVELRGAGEVAAALPIQVQPGAEFRLFDVTTTRGATITNNGRVAFFDSARGGTAALINFPTVAANGTGFETHFSDFASAESARITNHGSTFSSSFVGGGGATRFFENAIAGAAEIQNGGGLASGAYGGETMFADTASAGTATLINRPGAVGGIGGRTVFRDQSSGGDAAIENRGNNTLNTTGGRTLFEGTGLPGVSAGRARITNRGSQVAGAHGFTHFIGTASAGDSTIFNEAGVGNGASGGAVTFASLGSGQNATASRATITNQGGLFSNASGGQTTFFSGSTAADADLTNQGGSVAGAFGGQVAFSGTSTAARSTIRNEGGKVNGAGSGSTSFSSSSSAGEAILYAHAAFGTAPGGSIIFSNGGDGGAARVIIEGGPGLSPGGFDISLLTSPGMSIGSIEGGGIISLGQHNLAVGGNNLSTTFSGLIRDGGFAAAETGGSLTKVGARTLVLSGVNTYTGITRVLEGILRVEGSLAGAVSVEGGSLGGNGMLNGGVAVGPGGVFAPGGSIGYLQTAGLLAFGSGSVFGLEIDSSTGTTDSAAALGISIGTGVNLFGEEIGAGWLPAGLQFRILDNVSADPTTGRFANFDEGAEGIIGNNLFAITYFGGDGNDVVLTTVVPEPCATVLALLAATALLGRRSGRGRRS